MIEFLMNQIVLVPLLTYLLWRRYKTGRFFPNDDPNIKTPSYIWFTGAASLGVMAILSFWINSKFYSILFVVLLILCLFGFLREKFTKNL